MFMPCLQEQSGHTKAAGHNHFKSTKVMIQAKKMDHVMLYEQNPIEESLTTNHPCCLWTMRFAFTPHIMRSGLSFKHQAYGLVYNLATHHDLLQNTTTMVIHIYCKSTKWLLLPALCQVCYHTLLPQAQHEMGLNQHTISLQITRL